MGRRQPLADESIHSFPQNSTSDPLRQRLQKRGIELIAPYRENRKERRFEDGRKLRRYKRRWIVERTNSMRMLSPDLFE